MMRTRLGVALVTALMSGFSSAPVRAAFVDGNELWTMCRHGPDRSLECMSYVRGVVDALDIPSPAGTPFCIRNGVTVGQLTDVVANFLQATPEARDADGAALVRHALSKTFPCP